MSEDFTQENYDRSINEYKDYINTYVDGFVSKLFSDGIVTEVDSKKLKQWFSNPDAFQKEIENIAQYYYITNGEIFQLLDITRVLPTLNYKLDVFEKNKSYEKHMGNINKLLYKIGHKTLTRDMISQTITSGTLCGIWLGDSKNPYFYIFDDLDYVFPSHRLQGEWQVTVDMSWFDTMTDYMRTVTLENLSPYITDKDYQRYKSNSTKSQYKYIDLPQERTGVIRTHTLKRSQNRGVSWITQGMYDILHKKKLKDLEKAVANKIINAVAVLKVGSEANDGQYANMKLPKGVKKKIHSGVKGALEKNSKDGITVVTIPEFADIEFPDIKSGNSLDPKKFDSINHDITSSYGLSQSLLNGTGSNFASAKINIDVLYKKIGDLLEDIERIYAKLFNIVLPSNQTDNFTLTYDKEQPLTLKEKIDVLLKLHTQEGFALKPIVDMVSGINFDEYIEQSVYEQEVLKLQEKIKPYASAYTSTGQEEDGRPEIESQNENTIKSKENDSNSLPE
ncbi:hypothetical protein BEH_07270 [Priestia filamentosa]|uniref:Uncharacterized protein n=1 Tax=Priestia filamentosa TaxID=1402861 RepID=A0A0H4KHZ9_9BACI|nr:hypothetical protein [Priestia filamentosa]AKO91919.1 hypothetical protein BEH_07270 [Priestia filamentosa]